MNRMIMLACVASLVGSGACILGDIEESATGQAGEESDGPLERESAGESDVWVPDDRDADAVAGELADEEESALCHHLGTWTYDTGCTYYADLVNSARFLCAARGGYLKSHRFELTCAPHAYRRIVYSCCRS